MNAGYIDLESRRSGPCRMYLSNRSKHCHDRRTVYMHVWRCLMLCVVAHSVITYTRDDGVLFIYSTLIQRSICKLICSNARPTSSSRYEQISSTHNSMK